MRKYLLGGAAAAAMAAMPAIAQVAQPAPAPQVLIQRAPMAAKVHTRADVGTHVRTMFERLDANRDGFVTKAEAQAVRAQHLAKRIERRGAGAPGRPMADRPMPDRGAMFDRLDTNRDGSISRAEFQAAPARQERRIVMHSVGPAGAPEGMRMKRGMRMGMGMGLRGAMFDMADANKDGRVTLQEATAAAYRHFDMADANRDGQVTPDERMQMRQRMRSERRPG